MREFNRRRGVLIGGAVRARAGSLTAALAVGLLLGGAPAARAESVLVDNTALVSGVLSVPGMFGGTGYTGVGTAFSVGAAATARHIDLMLSGQPGPATLTVALRADAAGQPGAVLASGDLCVVARPGTALVSLDLPADVALNAGTPYWITATPSSGTLAWAHSAGPALALIGATTTVLSGNAMNVRVRGDFAATGACCHQGTLGCLVLSAADCAQFQGAFRGASTACTPGQCAAPAGACCGPSACTLTTQAGCIGPSRWLGAATTCGAPALPNPCCPADFDNSAGGHPDLLDIFAFLQQWFAGCP